MDIETLKDEATYQAAMVLEAHLLATSPVNGFEARRGNRRARIDDLDLIIESFLDLGATPGQIGNALAESILDQLGIVHKPLDHGLTLAICGRRSS